MRADRASARDAAASNFLLLRMIIRITLLRMIVQNLATTLSMQKSWSTETD